MRYFIVASHGPLSTAILESASLIAGKETFRNFRAIYVTMQDSPENIRQTVDNCIFRKRLRSLRLQMYLEEA